MKRLLLLLAFLACTTFALANSSQDISIVGEGGVLTGSKAGFSLTGEVLADFNGALGNLGTLTFNTGKFMGSLLHGGHFADGGTFTITGDGMGGTHNGVIFSGMFDDLKWKLITASNGTHFYDLLGSFEGKWFTGQKVDGAITLLTETTGTGFFNGSVKVVSSDINAQIFAPVPEPSSLLLLGTGLAGMAWRVRRAISARNSKVV